MWSMSNLNQEPQWGKNFYDNDSPFIKFSLAPRTLTRRIRRVKSTNPSLTLSSSSGTPRYVLISLDCVTDGAMSPQAIGQHSLWT